MASLVGRFIRVFYTVLALWAVMSGFAQAAPFAGIVMDARSGEILWAENADTKLHPASLTKMMTLYIAFQEIQSGRMSLDTVVTVSKNAASQPPSRLGLKPGQKIQLRYLIRAAAIKSANDAASAIGDAIGGSEAAFAKRMNRTAKALGMRNSSFKNANGLTAAGHLSTARDMTILGRHLFYDFPQFYGLFSRRTEDAGVAQVRNTNTRFLDSYEGADGIKTGYTVAAGYNLTASAKRGNKRVIATVLGGKSTAWRNAKMKELLDRGFGNAKNRVQEKVPQAAPIEDLIAEKPVTIEPSAAKQVAKATLNSSPRPMARPAAVQAQAPEQRPSEQRPSEAASLAAAAPAEPPPFQMAEEEDAIAMAIALGVQDALAEATAEAPPEPEVKLAAAEPVVEAGMTSSPRPRARPEQAAKPVETAPAEIPFQMVAEAEPEVKLEVVKMAAAPEPAPVVAAEPRASAPQQVAAAQQEIPFEVVRSAPDGSIPAVQSAPQRRAPIYDAVQLASDSQTAPAEQIVVSKSTSGGRQYSVNVGAYNSRYEAEKALIKTALAESATLAESLRKITEKGGKYRASFLGLSADQAELACRRLKARGLACETSGPA